MSGRWGRGWWFAAAALGLVASTVGLVPPPSAADPLFVKWSDYLPTFTDQYDPNSANGCVRGSVRCVDAVIREMTRRFNPLARACDHNAVFSLTYLRTTQEYRRTIEDRHFFSDTPFVNHQDAVFARYYFDAWDDYRRGDLGDVSQAWQLALAAANAQQVNGTGNLLLGMSAHVNRDLPYVLASIGLVKPDGTSRKPDHDKVNEFLNRVIEPLLIEAAARFDPTIDDADVQGTTLDATGAMQILVAWREEAWRNAEALVAAETPEEHDRVANRIEIAAAIEAQLIIASTAYDPADAVAAGAAATALNLAGAIFTPEGMAEQVALAATSRATNVERGLLEPSGAADRNAYCAEHWDD